MHKGIVGLAVFLCLAGVSSALPTMSGGGGTIYLDFMVDGVGQVIQYIDLNSDWTVKTGLTTLTTVMDTAMPAKPANADSSRGYGVATGLSADMGGVYHGATLVLTANSRLITVSGQSGIQTVVNTGDPGFSGIDFQKVTAVGAGFTPDGSIGIGTVGYDPGNSNSGRNSVWTGSGSSYVTRAAVPGAMVDSSASTPAWSNSPAVYADCYYTPIVGIGTVSGAMAWADTATGHLMVVYRLTGGGYAFVDGSAGNAVGRSTGSSDAVPMAAGDTNNDGIPDFYFQGRGGVIYHDQDINGNGTWADSEESVYAGFSTSETWDGTGGALAAFRASDGSWAILALSSAGTVTLYPLDWYGNYASGAQIITTGATVSGMYGTGIVFETLASPASLEPFPEPCTLLLLGTGMVGLSRVIRRRK